MKLSEILTFQDFVGTFTDRKLPIKIAYAFQKYEKQIEPSLEFYRNKIQEIVANYAEKDENGNPVLINEGRGISVKEEFREQCEKEITELYSLEVDVDPMNFTIEDLEKVEGLELTIPQLATLSNFIKQD